MKLSEYAKRKGVSYRTAWRWFRSGILNAEQMPTGTIIVRDDISTRVQELTVIYARVSAVENKSNLESQVEHAHQYCVARGYQIGGIIKEIGSGLNDQRPKLIKLLNDPTARRIVVEHKDILTRFGFNYIETLLKQEGRSIEVINLAIDGNEDLRQDFIAIITSFCARLYGQRRAKRITDNMLAELTDGQGVKKKK
ncbi:MAG: IS607 family transposase [Chloracidobacterium sp.]|nr:IS607 family transposase [Chloracidobacterium sp.]